MDRNLDTEAAIILNDLDSMVHRIEMLQAHPEYTAAVTAVLNAKSSVTAGRVDLHRREMNERFAKQVR